MRFFTLNAMTEVSLSLSLSLSLSAVVKRPISRWSLNWPAKALEETRPAMVMLMQANEAIAGVSEAI